ncbi:AI-2E family transporter [Bradyrhizobium sp. USDA 4353]
MSRMQAVVFWIAVLAAITAAVALLRYPLRPFFAGLVLAYLLNPLVGRLERLGMSRLIAALAIVVTVGAGLAAVIILVLPIIASELRYFVDSFPRYLKQLESIAMSPHRPWLSKIVGQALAQAELSVDELTKVVESTLGELLSSLWSGSRAFITVFSLAVVTPVITVHLIRDWNKMLSALQGWTPPAHRHTVRTLAREIDRAVGGFVQGQVLLCGIVGLFYAVALYSVGLNHGVLIGIAAGLISFVPYLGSIAGVFVSTCVAIAQFWPNVGPIVIVPLIFVVGQMVADYVLSPYLVGRRINLHPVWVVLALFVFGYLFGMAGLLLAVPVAAAIGVLIRFSLKQYLASSFYSTRLPNDAPGCKDGRGDDCLGRSQSGARGRDDESRCLPA